MPSVIAHILQYFPHEIIYDTGKSELYKIFTQPTYNNLYLKIYKFPSWRDTFERVFRGSLFGSTRAKIEYKNLQHLNKIGISPKPVSLIQQRSFGFIRNCYILLEEVPDSLRLDDFIFNHLDKLSPQQREQFITSLALTTRKMNLSGFVNGEFHWRNVLVVQKDNPLSFSFYIIDCCKSRLRDKYFSPHIDLATLDIYSKQFFTTDERLQFLKVYLDRSGDLTKEDKKFVQKIISLRKKLAKTELKKYKTCHKNLTTPPPPKKHFSKPMNQNYENPTVVENYATRFTKPFRHTHTKEYKSLQNFLKKTHPIQSILDIPCGTGRFHSLFLNHTHQITAVDYSHQMLEKAKENCLLLGDENPKIEFIHGTIFDIPVPDKSFDVVIVMRLYYYFATRQERKAILKELQRVSKKWVIISFFNAQSYQHIRRVIRRKLGKSSHRYAISIREFNKELINHGMQLYAVQSNARYISEQTLALIRV